MKGLFQCPPRATPWVKPISTKSPCKGKSFEYEKLLPLQGVVVSAYLPRALPWARSFCPFRACGAYLKKSENYLTVIWKQP